MSSEMTKMEEILKKKTTGQMLHKQTIMFNNVEVAEVR